jgi:hypothetical protein
MYSQHYIFFALLSPRSVYNQIFPFRAGPRVGFGHVKALVLALMLVCTSIPLVGEGCRWSVWSVFWAGGVTWGG